MTEPKAMAANCEHYYDGTRILGGHPLHVSSCYFCRRPDWDDLMEQAVELYRWGWQEGRAGKPPRDTLSAYEKPREAPGGDSAPQAAMGDPELTAEEARGLADELGTELYRAQDRLAFIAELLDAAERGGATTVDISRVRGWLDGPKCGMQIAAENPDLYKILTGAATEATHDTGPSVREAAADDRRWFDGERGGE